MCDADSHSRDLNSKLLVHAYTGSTLTQQSEDSFTADCQFLLSTVFDFDGGDVKQKGKTTANKAKQRAMKEEKSPSIKPAAIQRKGEIYSVTSKVG